VVLIVLFLPGGIVGSVPRLRKPRQADVATPPGVAPGGAAERP